jgi:hypothetical protein
MPFDYESLAFTQQHGLSRTPHLIEAYTGQSVVAWQGKIERQIEEYITENDEARNHPYANKLREFLRTWRAYPLTGSINVEDVEKLMIASEQLAVDPWRYQNYFSHLRDQLRKLKASGEQLPTSDEIEAAERSGGAGAPPNSFGPQDTAGAAPNMPPEAAAAPAAAAPQ